MKDQDIRTGKDGVGAGGEGTRKVEAKGEIPVARRLCVCSSRESLGLENCTSHGIKNNISGGKKWAED